MKNILYLLFLLSFSLLFGQTGQFPNEQQRIETIKNQLTILSTETLGLTENVKTEISVNNISLANFLLALSDIHKVNINVAPELSQVTIANNFSNVTVADLLIFLCKEYDLTIDFTGNILSIKKYEPTPPKIEQRIIPIAYDPSNNTISLDAKEDKLYDVFKKIMDESAKNIVFSPGLENRLITVYINDTPFETAMDNLAFANNLYMEKSKDGFFVFEDNTPTAISSTNNPNTELTSQRPTRRRNSNFFFKIKVPEQQLLEVDFVNTPIADIINDIGNELNIDIFTATPLDEAGTATFTAKSITFDELLSHLFEVQSQTISNTNTQSNENLNNLNQANFSKRFTFKKENNIYFFGTENQLSVRKVAIIHLQHRSVELLSDPAGGGSSSRSAGRNFNSNNNFNNFNGISNTPIGSYSQNRNREPVNTNSNQNFNNFSNKVEALINILPNEIKQDLDITVDYELNSFYVTGPSTNVERFKDFINRIDKPVPVILIEVMLIEVNNTTLVEAGVSWGIGAGPTTTQGGIFPETNLTLGAKTINKVIGGFDGFGSFNLGKVVPNFFATIKAMESNGNLKIRSTPKLSTLNGHRATFSNGQTSYYAVTQQAIIGSDNPVTQTAVNYVPIDAELGLTIKPLVSGDGQVTLDIFVVQSTFGARISQDAPPDISSREFSSIIRVKDQDIVVLGGLEEQMKNNSGSGVPFLARIPIIKWLFSKRKREAKKAKLTVLIKPTIIN
ncbi:general secretion pathway protein GspD [Subsaximicrobium wynnwilliamsii]|uniref:General secretion pathway protein GspD n=1 Tax=Subsaximicrobium wynnwilliamsii TaxID=291179 RepID=A0A5C6ZH08_9FLAO|nr:general secretion pathway protein GspD [Subsaximicrobium wynnwilliamsii]TXD83470.1 general secretion pathway protein GspD [Subsaximicrobium wynnwilliamsii]TXD89255.1 general secretion pathway protein GspD [Subsaximicrobium wynnwilliamsii]TXE03150.1 general secretion pathway protein GspD [Subsaximicrobium wynnwilliamsii]